MPELDELAGVDTDACALPDPHALPAPPPPSLAARGFTASVVAAAVVVKVVTNRWFSRAAWGARKHRGRTKLRKLEVIGLALHWPGMSKPLSSPTAVRAALRSWQAYHMDSNGWSDIAYQAAIDQWGNRYRLRGKAYKSGANGNDTLNRRYGALLLILAPGEQPSAKMLKAVRKYHKGHRKLYPNSTKLVGHGAIRPGGTACPGPAVQALLKAGKL